MGIHLGPYANICLKISDTKINELEIPTGNPLVVYFSETSEIVKYLYLDSKRKKEIFFNQ